MFNVLQKDSAGARSQVAHLQHPGFEDHCAMQVTDAAGLPKSSAASKTFRVGTSSLGFTMDEIWVPGGDRGRSQQLKSPGGRMIPCSFSIVRKWVPNKVIRLEYASGYLVTWISTSDCHLCSKPAFSEPNYKSQPVFS